MTHFNTFFNVTDFEMSDTGHFLHQLKSRANLSYLESDVILGRPRIFAHSRVESMALDVRPSSIVEDGGFRNLRNSLGPKYTIRNRRKLPEAALPEVFSLPTEQQLQTRCRSGGVRTRAGCASCFQTMQET